MRELMKALRSSLGFGQRALSGGVHRHTCICGRSYVCEVADCAETESRYCPHCQAAYDAGIAECMAEAERIVTEDARRLVLDTRPTAFGRAN